jgi:hypothetical protein
MPVNVWVASVNREKSSRPLGFDGVGSKVIVARVWVGEVQAARIKTSMLPSEVIWNRFLCIVSLFLDHAKAKGKRLSFKGLSGSDNHFVCNHFYLLV